MPLFAIFVYREPNGSAILSIVPDTRQDAAATFQYAAGYGSYADVAVE
jgi:hypothetical protein